MTWTTLNINTNTLKLYSIYLIFVSFVALFQLINYPKYIKLFLMMSQVYFYNSSVHDPL
jgi:hypothetical protein